MSEQYVEDPNDIPEIGVFVVAECNQKILLVRHNYRQKKWSLPGGAMKFGEQSPDTARREFYEETGLQIDDPKLIVIGTFGQRRGIVFFFHAHIQSGVLSNTPDGEIAERRWYSMEEIEELGKTQDIYLAQSVFFQKASFSPSEPQFFFLSNPR